MNFLQQIKNFFTPPSIKCNDLGSQNQIPFDPMAIQDQFQAHMQSKPHKVPGFQHFFNSVLMVTSNPQFIKGFKFEISFPLSQYFNFSHSWSIPNSGTQQQPNMMNPMMMAPAPAKPSYVFTTQLVRDIKGQQPGTIMVGKVDNEGKVDGIYIKKLAENISMRATANFPTNNVQQGVVSIDIDIENKNSMQAFKFGPGHFGFNIMQKIHPNLILGFDYMNLYSQKLSFFSYALKAFINKHSLFMQYVGIQSQFNVGYVIPIKKGSQFVAHYKIDERQKKSTTTLGFRQKYEMNDITATINSRGEISTNFLIKNNTFSVKLNALVDYVKQKYSFGYGISFGQIM